MKRMIREPFDNQRRGRKWLVLTAVLALAMGLAHESQSQQAPQQGGPVIVVAKNLQGDPFVPGTFSFDVQMIGHVGEPVIAYAFMASYDRRYAELVEVHDIGLGGQPPEMGPPSGEGPRGWRVLATLGNFHNDVLDANLVRLVFHVHSLPPPNYLVSIGPDPVNVPLVDREFRSIPHRYDNTLLVQAGLIPAMNQDFIPTPSPDLDPGIDGGVGGGGGVLPPGGGGYYDDDDPALPGGGGAPGTGGGGASSPVDRLTDHMRDMRERYFHSDVVVDERGVTRFADGRDQPDQKEAGAEEDDPLDQWTREQERAVASLPQPDSPLTAELTATTDTLAADLATTTIATATTATATATTATAALPQTVTIQGRVRHTQGRLLEDVSIVTDQGRRGAPTATTGANGLFTLTVPRGWSGRITPVLANHQLSPGSLEYEKVTENVVDQDFTAERFSDDLARYYNIVYRRNDRPTTSGLIFTHAGIRIMNGRSSDTITITLRDDHRGKAVPAIRELVSDAGMKRIHTETEITAIRVGGKLDRITAKRGEIRTISAEEVGKARLWMRRISPVRAAEYQLPSVAIATTIETPTRKMQVRHAGLDIARIESKQAVARHTVTLRKDRNKEGAPAKPVATTAQQADGQKPPATPAAAGGAAG